MKRKSSAIVDWEDIHATDVAEMRYNAQKFMQMYPNSHPFVVVRGPTTGLLNTWPEVQKKGLNRKGCVYKRLRAQEGLQWYNDALDLPPIDHPLNVKIHLAYYHGDITQDKDYACVVCANFLHPNYEHLNFCVTANEYCKNAPHQLFSKALQLIPDDVPISIFFNSYKIVYYLNYGLNNWPSHTLDLNRTDPDISQLRRQIDNRLASTAIDWSDHTTGNVAATKARTYALSHVGSGLAFNQLIRREQAITWILVAKRLDVSRDIRRMIALLIYNDWKIYNNYISVNQHIPFLL